jgi:hypothetical protein
MNQKEAMKNIADRPQAYYLVILCVVLALTAVLALAQGSGQSSAWDLPPGSSGLIQPQDLAKALQSGSAKLTVLYVGPHMMYAQAHIRGAEFIGPASSPQGLDNLRKRVANLPRNSAIVIYCGCCPWEHCPNIRPAYNVLQTMGFSKAKALYIAHNFGTDWLENGYPAEKGQ